MLKPRDIQLAEQAAREDDKFPQSAPAIQPNPQAVPGALNGPGLPQSTKHSGGALAPASPSLCSRRGNESLTEQLENLRKHLRTAHELVGRELYAICEAKLARPLSAADKMILQSALLRMANEIHDITQMVEQCQLSATFAKTL